ncbi:MAG: GGDEF domain-containing protein [Pseudomonadota bacterium]
MRLRRENDYAEMMVMLNTILFGIGAAMVTLVWTKSISKHGNNESLWQAVFSFSEPLLLVTVAILLGGVFHSITVLYPAMLEKRADRQKTLNQINDYKDQAYRDPLTELHNRRYFDATLDAYFAEFGRANLSFGLMAFDVDHFKRVNDTYGHSVGDAVLKEIAWCTQSLAREHDVVARIGGEEFAVIVTHVNDVQLKRIAERFRKKIATLSIEVEGEIIRPTISIGAVTSTKFGATEILFEVADQCLYKAKESGRNCVIIYDN